MIIDSVRLDAGQAATLNKHGEDNKHGLFANGHRLVLGTGIESVGTSSLNSYTQVFGGYYSGGNEERELTSTDVVIFSGTYYNVVAGSSDQNINGDTHLVIRGSTTVLDTVLGGNATGGSTVENTFVYVIGGCLPADSYQEKHLGTSENVPVYDSQGNRVFLEESTILTGGSNDGKITDDTHVFISGDANLWDVQGGGRRGGSTVDGTVNVEVSGQGKIRHVLCGSITDGSSQSVASVKKVQMTVKQGAAVGSLFGAGYDTYYLANNPSMFGDGTIDIKIEGGTIGYVYGGGYRGAIGYQGDLTGVYTGDDNTALDSISITISGGTVLGDVYGGGRGGVDKVIHNSDGGLGGLDTGSVAKYDTTGFAWTKVKSLSISISGNAKVEGSVYGGGESVPMLSSAPGISNLVGRDKVASVEADEISISVSGEAVVEGSVYGAGKGVDASSYSTNTITISGDNTGGWSINTDVPWYATTGLKVNNTSDYSGYAQVGSSSNEPTIQVSVSGSATAGNGSTAVFGAGARAETYAESITVDASGTLKGSVYGAGESAATHVNGNIAVGVGNTSKTTLSGSVFGAGKEGETNAGSISITVGSGNWEATISGGVYGAGDGASATTTLSGSILMTLDDVTVGTAATQSGVYGTGRSASTKLDGDIEVIIAGDAGAIIHGNVFGTGKDGQTEAGSVHVSIGTGSGQRSTVDGGVYGTGQGTGARTQLGGSVTVSLGNVEVGKSGNTGVFGTGQSADTDIQGTIDLVIGDGASSTTINGGVYGTGEDAETKLALGTGSASGSDATDITITINNGSPSGPVINGDVYGAGKYGYTSSDRILIELGNGRANGPVINGNVHGGGLGTTGEVVVEADRAIVLNNATVNGSIFGGSRLGNDNNYDSNMTQIDKKAEIDLISGVVTQNVYGGAYQGHSAYNVEIRFGTPAVQNVQPDSFQSPVNLRVDSIYGGGYYDPSSTSSTQGPDVDTNLVKGDVEIWLGSGALTAGYQFPGYSNIGDVSSDSPKIAVYGDIFGDGNFSGIGGDSTLTFDGYRQTSDVNVQRMRSIQLADTVVMEDSEVQLSGSSAGGSEDLTERMSLNKIGWLEMHGHSVLTLHAEMNEIGAFASYNSRGNLAMPSDFDGSCGNTLRLIDGALAMILGDGNDGVSTGQDMAGMVYGNTIIDNGKGEDYYGAFAMGSSRTDENSGFIVSNGDGTYTSASYIIGNDDNIKIWFIAGATSMDRMLTFSPGDDTPQDSKPQDSTNVSIPKMSETSKLYYSGAYIDYVVQGSMYVVDPGKGISGSNTMLFGMSMVGKSMGSVMVKTHEYGGMDGSDVIWNVIAPEKIEVSQTFTLTSSLLVEPSTAGLLGYVVIHIVEAYDYGNVSVPIHVINLRVGMYMEPPESGSIDIEVTLTPGADGGYVGTGYIPFPSVGDFYVYNLSDFSAPSMSMGAITLTADTTQYGRNGWTSSQYMNNGYMPTSGDSVAFGVGGVVSPVIRVEYDGSALNSEPATLTFEVDLIPEDGEGSDCDPSYTVTVTFKYAEDVGIYLQYSEMVDHIRYVLRVTGDEEPIIAWVVAEDDDDTGDAIYVPFGTVISEYGYTATVNGTQYTTLSDVIDALINSITSDDVEDFSYPEHFVGWFSDSSMINGYDLGSSVSQDIILYAKFGVSVTFDFGNNTPQYQVIIGYGTSLWQSGIRNYLEKEGAENKYPDTKFSVIGSQYLDGTQGYTGHMLLSKDGWVADKADPGSEFDFDQSLYQDIDLYLVWKVEVYYVEVQLSGQTDGFGGGSFSVVNGTGVTLSDATIGFQVEYGKAVTITFTDPFHIGKTAASGTYDNGQQSLTFDGPTYSTKTLRFNVIDVGNDRTEEDPGKIVIKVTITDRFDVTVGLIHEAEFTSELGEGDSLVAAAGSNQLKLTAVGEESLKDLESGTGIKITTTQDKAPYGYVMSVWVNGDLVADRVSDYTVTVGSDVIDPEVTVALFKTVSLLNDMDWDQAHIGGVSVFQVVTPEDASGGWGYAQNPVRLTKADVGDGFQITEWDYFVIASMSGYTIVDENQYPNNVDEPTEYRDTLYFSPNMGGDVTFKALIEITSGLDICVTLLDSDGSAPTQHMLENIAGAVLTVTFNGAPTTATVSGDSTLNIKVEYPTSAGSIRYESEMSGFEIVTGYFNSNGSQETLEIEMKAIGYTVWYHPVEGDAQSEPWTVFDGEGIDPPSGFETAIGSDGKSVFVKTSNGTDPVKFIDAIVPGEFDNSLVLHITALAPPEGTTEGGTEPTVHGFLILLTSDIVNGQAVVGQGLFGGSDAFFAMDDVRVTYTEASGSLTFENGVGVGSLTMVSGEYALTIIVVPEATDITEVA